MQEHQPDTHRASPEELGLEPLDSYDHREIVTVDDMLRGMAKNGFEGGNLGRSLETFIEMVTNKDIFVTMTISGAMTPAGMSPTICEMIDLNMVDTIVCTGATMAHGLVLSSGLKHYKIPKHLTDTDLQKLKINRILDVGEPETNLDHVESIFNKVIDRMDSAKVFSSHRISYEIGKYLDENYEDQGILKSAYRQGVPVIIPAFSDSELGLDFKIGNDVRHHLKQKELRYDDFIDLTFFSELIVTQALRGKKLGIFTIGGGVPRNWAQQVGPYIELREDRLAAADPNYKKIEAPMYQYGMRICPEPVGLGGLSGCTYEEGKSWRKFVEDATTSEVLVDATIAWPLVVQAALQRLDFKPIEKDVFSGKEAVAQIEEYINKRYNSGLT